ncbi:hypothetical protein [Providencia sp. wls1943]|nr:hypothetical protein [Providencia sp. wls1943]
MLIPSPAQLMPNITVLCTSGEKVVFMNPTIERHHIDEFVKMLKAMSRA